MSAMSRASSRRDSVGERRRGAAGAIALPARDSATRRGKIGVVAVVVIIIFIIRLCLVFKISGRSSPPALPVRSEEHTSELQSLMRISYAVFCFKKKKQKY